MMPQSPRSVVVVLVVLLFVMAGAATGAPVDPRFFGTYCGEADIEHCVTVRVQVLGVTVATRRQCRTIALRRIRARLEHIDTPAGGLVSGHGTAEVDGELARYVLAGTVQHRGLVRGSATVAGLGPQYSSARLSADGLGLQLHAYGKQVTIRKDACGNRPPEVQITAPGDGAVIAFGRMQQFAATITDPEDDTFAETRLRFDSDRDGPLGTGRLLFRNTLSPGAHRITFTAVDSGGLAATDSVRIVVQNRPPDPPTILRPEAGATLVATGPVTLEGKAFDREDGMLDGTALAWSSRREGSPDFTSHGFGRRSDTTFAEPGTYTLRLTASDGLGVQRATERVLTVQPFAGNTPPQVSIRVPDQLGVRGEVAAALVAGEVEFVGTVTDLEDPPDTLLLHWRAEPLQPPGPAFEFGTGTVATATLPAIGGANTRYRITFTATDSDGFSGSTGIDLLILARPIL